MSELKGVVFDLEDTLYDKADWIVPAIEYAAGLFGLDQTRTLELVQEYQQRHGSLDAGIYNFVLVGCGQFDTAMNVRALCAWANQYQPAHGSLQYYPGALEAIKLISMRHKLAIVTEGPVAAQKMKLSALGVEPIIPAIVYADEIDGIRSRLPNPRAVMRAADRLNLKPAEVLWVADNPMRDFIHVREGGFITARVLTGEHATQDPPSTEHAADYNISSVARLPALLAELEDSVAPEMQTDQSQPPRLTLLTQERRF